MILMMTHYQYLDELVKEYLLFRGFTATLKSFDTDLKNEKEKGFRVDKIVDQISQSISSHDLSGLLDLWKHFDTKIFSKLETNRLAAVRKLENSIYKLYAVQCVQSKQSEKLREFFERMTGDLHSQNEWKDWFALPYIKDPADSLTFSLYFSRQWQDTLMMSLSNFLSIIFHGLPPPRLADHQKTAARFNVMREEIKRLKLKLAAAELDLDTNLAQGDIRSLKEPPVKENMDDFFMIAQETAVVDNQVKSLKSFLRNITGGNSGDRKKSPVNKSRSSSKSRQAVMTSASLLSQSVPGAASSRQVKKTSQSSIKSDQLPVVVCSNTTTASKPASVEVEPMQRKSKPEKLNNEPNSSSSTSVDSSSTSNYLLLGQESYSEHRSEVILLSSSTVGGMIVSADKSGVIKVWSPSPSPTTSATFISGSPVSAVCWVEASDKYFLYGTSSGQVRLCDVQDKMSVAEVPPDLISGHPVTVLQPGPSSATFLLIAGLKVLIMETANCKLDKDLSQASLTNISCAQFNHNGNILIHGGMDGKVGMTDVSRGELLCTWSVHQRPVTSLRLNNDQTGVWSLAGDSSLAFSNIVRTNDKVWEGLVVGPEKYQDVKPSLCVSSSSDHMLTNCGGSASIYRLPNISGTDSSEPETKLEKMLTLTSEGVSSVLWCGGECSPAITGHHQGQINIYTLLTQ